MSLKMINDYVLIKTTETATISKGGIIVTNGVLEPPCVGVIISIGEGKILNNGTRAEHNLQQGDTVVFGKSSLNQPIEEDGQKYYVMKIEEIFGKKN